MKTTLTRTGNSKMEWAVLRTGRFARWPSTLAGLVFLAALFSPMIGYLGHGFVLAWTVIPIWLLLLLLEAPIRRSELGRALATRSRQFIFLSVWMGVILLNILLGHGLTGSVHLVYMANVLLILVMDVLLTAAGSNYWKRLVVLSLCLLGLEVMRSLPVLAAEPRLAKLIMQATRDPGDYARALTSGVGEYNFYTALAMLTPILLALVFKTRGPARFFMLLCLAGSALAISLATFMGSILLMLAGMALLGGFNFLFARRKLVVGLSLTLIVAVGLLLWAVYVRNTTAWSNFSMRFSEQMTGIMEEGLVEGDTTNRGDLWLASINTFQKYPIFGFGPVTNRENEYMGVVVGGHSSILDILAEYGLVGAAAYYLFLFSSFGRGLRNYLRHPRDILAQARLVTLVLFVAGSTYNPVFFVPQINVVIFFYALGGIEPVVRPARQEMEESIPEDENEHGST